MYITPLETSGDGWLRPGFNPHDHASCSWWTFCVVICLSGLYPQPSSVRRQCSQSAGSGLSNAASVTGATARFCPRVTNPPRRITMTAATMRMRLFMRWLLVVSAGASLAGGADQETWIFNRLDRIGGHRTTIVGDPRVIDTPVGKAIEFDGIDVAIFVDVHPLAGAETFTWEAIFRPDGGQPEQ